MKSKLKNIVYDIIIFLLVFISITMFLTELKTGSPSVLGYCPIFVVSGSMEPTIMTGRFVLAKQVNEEDININDIYVYKNNKKRIIHRIIAAKDNGYLFKGDNNTYIDNKIVSKNEILYKVIWYPHF